jgi:hypothetical protein
MVASNFQRSTNGSRAISISRAEETWAIALHLDRTKGDDAPAHIAERIGAMAVDGDMDGLLRWREIAAALFQLRTADCVKMTRS